MENSVKENVLETKKVIVMVIGGKSAVSCDCVKLCNLYFIGQVFKIILDFLLF